ncbi:FxsB family cyclophane-forming radical SAM/SPASM peptide maturase [Dactylosporangium roseum]|uniref:FxsB family cyclophane-forming radical SAM/SPASM peptide maturase n=1 Tax=Dactylosporangium roseum TaxID=47989 RepID=UPI0021B17484|nr:FxsB family cyclophane-forming radical SAM/SPASM peptide maturase [Dactylosporangium roseum]
MPFRQFVLKLHSRCNLACDYCYVYEMADSSWRGRPRVMPPETVDRTAYRIAEHVSAHRLPAVEVVLHGGEPLLAGADAVRHVAAAVRQALPPGVALDITVQTNGTLLDHAMLDVLRDLGVRVGVSLDGTPGGQDRHRRFPDGRGSHAVVADALRRLRRPENRRLYAGLLAVVDLDEDPVAAYEALLAHEPPRMDFLLPHGNWSVPPPGRTADQAQTPYGDWLAAVFDRWYDAPRPETGVRLFEEILSALLGGASRTEQIGLSPVTLLVVESDGTLEQVDTLRSAFEGAAVTGLNVFDHRFDAALTHPDILARQGGVAGLAEACRRCDLVRVCGGGYYPHRYRAGAGFRNPSVYCADLYRIVSHVRARVGADLARLAAGRS